MRSLSVGFLSVLSVLMILPLIFSGLWTLMIMQPHMMLPVNGLISATL